MGQLRMLKIINNKGDTIVEVLIALAVLMVIIAGGYSIATRSLNGARIAQERSEATMIAQGQLEAINQRVDQAVTLGNLSSGDSPGGIPAVNRGNFLGGDSDLTVGSSPPRKFTPLKPGFCVNNSGKAVNSDTDAACIINGLYNIKITTKATGMGTSGLSNLQYTVTISWDKSGGGTQETLQLVGRYVIK